MKYISPLSIVLFSLMFSPLSLASDKTEPPAKLALCQSCHGVDGIGTNDKTPNLALQKKNYLIHELKAFREKGRVNPIMNHVGGALTDAEIESISAYYSNQNPYSSQNKTAELDK